MTLGDGMKKRMLSKLMDSDAATNLTGIIAEVENELLQAAKPLDDELGTGHIDRVPSVEVRRDALKSLLEAVATDSMREVWVAEILPEIVENDDKAEQYVGLGDESEAWEKKQAAWAEGWRDNGAEGTDRALAEHHIRDTFGADPETFESRVVGFNAGEEAERLFAANFRAVKRVLEDAAGEVGGDA